MAGQPTPNEPHEEGLDENHCFPVIFGRQEKQTVISGGVTVKRGG